MKCSPTCEDDCKWAADTCNTYFDHYLPTAVVTAKELKASSSSNASFVYFTHPWLLQEYFDGSAGCGRDVSTRNATERAQVEAAVRAGERFHSYVVYCIYMPAIDRSLSDCRRDLLAREALHNDPRVGQS